MARKSRARWVGPRPATKLQRVRKKEAEPQQQVEVKSVVMLETTEQVIAEMQLLCDEVDAQMEKELINDFRTERNFYHYYQKDQPWRGFFDRRAMLCERLEELETTDDNRWDFDKERFLRPHLTRTAPGEVPSWARPGFFVLWIGSSIPVGCRWEGFITPSSETMAVDPGRPWISSDGDHGGSVMVKNDFRTVDDLFRAMLETWTKATEFKKNIRRPTFKPVSLHPDARATVQLLQKENPWLREVLNNGPRNQVPMPPHIRSMQMALVA